MWQQNRKFQIMDNSNKKTQKHSWLHNNVKKNISALLKKRVDLQLYGISWRKTDSNWAEGCCGKKETPDKKNQISHPDAPGSSNYTAKYNNIATFAICSVFVQVQEQSTVTRPKTLWHKNRHIPLWEQCVSQRWGCSGYTTPLKNV